MRRNLRLPSDSDYEEFVRKSVDLGDKISHHGLDIVKNTGELRAIMQMKNTLFDLVKETEGLLKRS